MAANPTFSSRDRPMGRVFRFVQPVVFCVATLLLVNGHALRARCAPHSGCRKSGGGSGGTAQHRRLGGPAARFARRLDSPLSGFLQSRHRATGDREWQVSKSGSRLSTIPALLCSRSSGAAAQRRWKAWVSPPPARQTRKFQEPVRQTQWLGIVWPIPPRKRRVALKKDWAVAFGGVAASGTGTVTTNNASGTQP